MKSLFAKCIHSDMVLIHFPKTCGEWPVIYNVTSFPSLIGKRLVLVPQNYCPFTPYLWKVNEEHVGVDLTHYTNNSSHV